MLKFYHSPACLQPYLLTSNAQLDTTNTFLLMNIVTANNEWKQWYMCIVGSFNNFTEIVTIPGNSKFPNSTIHRT